MNFNIEFDPTSYIEAAKTQIDTACKNVFIDRIKKFFSVIVDYHYDSVKGCHNRVETLGIGLQHIDDAIAERFLDPRFQEHLNQFFEDNWKRIYEECMVRALQHKANGVAFNKVHALGLSSKEE